MICPAGQGPDLFETIEGCPQRPKKEIHEGSPSETVLPHGQACGPASRCAPPLRSKRDGSSPPPGARASRPPLSGRSPAPLPRPGSSGNQAMALLPPRLRRRRLGGSTVGAAAKGCGRDARAPGGHPAGLSRIRPVCSPCCAPASRPVDPVYRCSMLQQTELTGHGLCSP